LHQIKLQKKDTNHLVSLTTVHKVSRPRYQAGDFVRIAKEDLPFKKGYKQSFTDELFEIIEIATVNPPTYELKDSQGEIIRGKFYEPELTKVNG